MPKEILIIDDDRKFRRMIKRALAADGYSFVEADSVESALAICAERQELGVILLDLELSGQSGTEFLQRLGDNSSKYRIIILTQHEEYLAAELAREFRVFRYLHKPDRLMESLRFTVSQAFKDLERDQDKNALLVQIQHRINEKIRETNSTEETQRALRDVLAFTCESLRKIVGAYSVHVRVYNLQTGDFQLAACAGPTDVIGEILRLPKKKTEPLSGIVAQVKKALYIYELQIEPQFKEWREESLNRLRGLGNDILVSKAEAYFDKVRSAYLVPITTHLYADEIDAIFNVSSDSTNLFSAEKQSVIQEFVDQATTAITKAWQTLRLRQSHQDYRNINSLLEDISKALRGENAKPEIYDIVVEGIAQIIRPEAISIYVYDKSAGVLINKAEYRSSSRYEPSIEGHPRDEGLTALVFSTGMPLRVPNLQAGDRHKPVEHANASYELYNRYLAFLPSGRVDHYLAVPMIVGNEVIGVIQLLNRKSAYYGDEVVDKERWLLERGFSHDSENVLRIAASYIALAIKNAELLEERRKQISQLAILKDVGRSTSSDTLSDLLDKIIGQAVEVTQAEMCLLFLLDETNDRLVLRQRYGISEKELPAASYETGEGITGAVAATGKSVLFRRNVPPGRYDQDLLNHLHNTYGPHKTVESMMIVPIRAEGEVLGVIKLINKRGATPYYDEDDLSLLEHFAGYVGLALKNKQQYKAAVSRSVTAEGTATLSSHMVRAVLHEINNTQALIPVNIQLIRERLARSNFDVTQMLDIVEEVSLQTLTFANSIQAFDISRLKEQKILNINEVITKAFSQVVPTLEKDPRSKRVLVDLKLSVEPLMCAVYETPFVQVTQNIIINAY